MATERAARAFGGHERPIRGRTDEWLTPPEIIEALGPFDLDPCAPSVWPTPTKERLDDWPHAALCYSLPGDGLAEFWPKDFFVWLNPPFGPEAEKWVGKLAEQNNGIALVAARTETRWFRKTIWLKANALYFLHGRPHFYHRDGTRAAGNAGVPICLAGYGKLAVERLEKCELPGTFMSSWWSV